MERIKKCPVLFLLVISGVLFSLVGIIGSNSVYKEYEFHIVEKPFLALMMEGMSKGVAPWEVFGIKAGSADDVQAFAQNDGQSMEGISGESDDAVIDEAIAGDSTQIQSLEAAEEEPANGMEAQTLKDEVEAAYEFQTVTEDYFNDAVFIGDSRTVGLYEYAGMEERADFFAKISLTIYDVFTEKVARDAVSGRKITIEEALTQKQYGKVYLMLGINELGTGNTESFMKEYKNVVARIRQLQPDAVIFVQGIMRVTGEKDETDPIFNNTNINEKNAEIEKLANGEDIFYIDVNEVVCDGEGNLNEEYTIDEIHLKAKYYEIWKEFLLKHGVVK